MKRAWRNESFKVFIRDIAIGIGFSVLWPVVSLIIILCCGVSKFMDYLSQKAEEKFQAEREPDVGLGG
jgi:hypothetical protein